MHRGESKSPKNPEIRKMFLKTEKKYFSKQSRVFSYYYDAQPGQKAFSNSQRAKCKAVKENNYGCRWNQLVFVVLGGKSWFAVHRSWSTGSSERKKKRKRRSSDADSFWIRVRVRASVRDWVYARAVTPIIGSDS